MEINRYVVGMILLAFITAPSAYLTAGYPKKPAPPIEAASREFDISAWFTEPISESKTPLQFRAGHLLCQVRLNSRLGRVGANSTSETSYA
jgi:hypothetical protein